VLTGGEPLLQPLKELIDHPLLDKFSFQIETAGSYWPIGGLTAKSAANHRLSVVCSPKTGSVVSALRHLGLFNVYWKYIVRASEPVAEDGLPIMSTQIKGREQKLFRPINIQDPKIRSRIFVQGCDEGDNPETNANVEYAKSIALQYNFRLSLQTHKILGLD
jgi:organic radical activating enzyme